MADPMPDDVIGRVQGEAEWSFARSGGPGGQNVNKVASKAVLRWNPRKTTAIDAGHRHRFLERYAGRLTEDGDLLITGQATRDQGRNREDCVAKLAKMLELAWPLPTVRKATKPSKASKRRRLDDKKANSARKSDRKVSE